MLNLRCDGKRATVFIHLAKQRSRFIGDWYYRGWTEIDALRARLFSAKGRKWNT
jgi:hypothetical protein